MSARWNKQGGLDRFLEALAKNVGPAMHNAGEIVADRAKGSIMEGSASAGRHVPSLPGQPPNNDTKHLHDNIEVVQENPFRVLVSSNAKYSALLEYGSSRMDARPFMRPARDASRVKVVAAVRLGVDRAIKEAGK